MTSLLGLNLDFLKFLVHGEALSCSDNFEVMSKYGWNKEVPRDFSLSWRVA